MPLADLLLTGLELMVLGMGIVFVFLMTLIFALHAMSHISSFFSHEETGIAVSKPVTQKIPENTALIAVISAAVAKYRATHQ